MIERREVDDATDAVATDIFRCALAVHSELGAGLIEAVYEECLARELRSLGHRVEQQWRLPIIYKGEVLDRMFRLDLVVAKRVIVEVKSVDYLAPVHFAQTYTYLKLSGYCLGLLVNFNVPHLRQGIRRIVLSPA